MENNEEVIKKVRLLLFWICILRALCNYKINHSHLYLTHKFEFLYLYFPFMVFKLNHMDVYKLRVIPLWYGTLKYSISNSASRGHFKWPSGYKFWVIAFQLDRSANIVLVFERGPISQGVDPSAPLCEKSLGQ